MICYPRSGIYIFRLITGRVILFKIINYLGLVQTVNHKLRQAQYIYYFPKACLTSIMTRNCVEKSPPTPKFMSCLESVSMTLFENRMFADIIN